MFSIFAGKEKLATFPQRNEIIRSLVGGTISIFILKWSFKNPSIIPGAIKIRHVIKIDPIVSLFLKNL